MPAKRYARIQSGIVQEVVVVPEGMTLDRMFHADLLPQFVECTAVLVDGRPVAPRMVFAQGAFAPEPPAPPPDPQALLLASDQRAARKVEDLLDALLAKGTLSAQDLTGPTRDWLEQRKSLRSRG